MWSDMSESLVVGEIGVRDCYSLANCSTRHEEVNRLLPPQTRAARATGRPPFRAARARPPASGPSARRSGSISCSISASVDVELLAPRDLVEHERAAPPLPAPPRAGSRGTRPSRCPPAAGRSFCSISRRAKSSMRRSISRSTSEPRHFERHPRGELLHQLGPHVALGRVLALRARDPRARARAARRASRTRPRSLANSSSSSGSTPPLDRLDRHRVRDVGVRQLRRSRSPPG